MTPDKERATRRCFLAIPQLAHFEPVRETVKKSALSAGYRPVSRDDVSRGVRLPKTVVGELARTDCVIADVSGADPNVFFEMGTAQAMGKALFLLTQEPSTLAVGPAIADAPLLSYEPTPRGLRLLGKELQDALKRYKSFPRSMRRFPPTYATPFFVDWDLLSQPEAENLCLELLAQMGYQHLQWEKEAREFDLVAELPKKDPDGFQYRELWLVAMGRNAPAAMLLEMLAEDAEVAMHRLLRRGEWRRRIPRSQEDVPITLLFILFRETPRQAALFESVDRIQRARLTDRPYPTSFRVRTWDRPHLTSLVQQFPQIGFKYFSDEGRSRSKYRKTPEELYKENVELANRLTSTVAALENEKNRRVRAERDAIWKDISFSAAHRIGNPIFAIETNLDPLDRRIRQGRVPEALAVTVSIRVSVEKAKGIVDQFKSLTRAQEIHPVATLLQPILEDSCQTASSQGVICEVDCASDLAVHGDPERLGECFDELASNSLHWFDKTQKTISVRANQAEGAALPNYVDSSRRYALIHFRDNGTGVAPENKSRIFDAFFTTQEHGAGLGLALVRRVIEGHGGAITESGVPGQGADFEVYLPLASNAARSLAPESRGAGASKET